jgi:hypothetical protein
VRAVADSVSPEAQRVALLHDVLEDTHMSEARLKARGAQGNALKTIVAIPFVLDGEEGRVEITGGGVKHEVAFSVDRIAQRPVAEVSRSPEAGSQIRVWWPTARA